METGTVVAIGMAAIAILSNVVAVTVFVVKLGSKIDVNNSTVIGKIDVIDNRVKSVEASLGELKSTDRRLSLVEDRQSALANRQGNVEQDNLLIRDDLNKLHQGLDRHKTSLQLFNETQMAKT